MSNLFNTNPKYLSQIIRESKNQNFNGYINQLRINYISNKLYNIPLYRNIKSVILPRSVVMPLHKFSSMHLEKKQE